MPEVIRDSISSLTWSIVKLRESSLLRIPPRLGQGTAIIWSMPELVGILYVSSLSPMNTLATSNVGKISTEFALVVLLGRS